MTVAPPDKKTFLLGLGAQKAGTTWLYHYLAASGRLAISPLKEYHVLDAMHIPLHRHGLVPAEQRELSVTHKLRFLMQRSHAHYADFFVNLMGLQSKPLSCDITPTYAGLAQPALRDVRQCFAERGVAVKALFLMRDPVERCWSAARMKRNTQMREPLVSDDEVVAHAELPGAVMRTRYDVTMAEIEAAFEPADIHAGLYEEMFQPESLAQISRFCGVPVRPELAGLTVNQSPAGQPLSDAARAAVARKFRPVYDFAAGRWPRATELWSGYRYL